MRSLFGIVIALALLASSGTAGFAGLSSDRPAASAPANGQDEARIDYELAERVGTREVWTSYLARHPTGFHADLARSKLKALEAEEQAARQKAIDEERRAKAINAKAANDAAAGPSERSRGGRSCTSTHTECVGMSMPFGPRWTNNCARLRSVCMRTGQWRSGLRNYSNVERR